MVRTICLAIDRPKAAILLRNLRAFGMDNASARERLAELDRITEEKCNRVFEAQRKRAEKAYAGARDYAPCVQADDSGNPTDEDSQEILGETRTFLALEPKPERDIYGVGMRHYIFSKIDNGDIAQA